MSLLVMIPPKSNLIWQDMVLGRRQYELKSLAAKILLNRILLSTKLDNSPQNVAKCVDEVYNFFVKNERVVQDDIKQIFE